MHRDNCRKALYFDLDQSKGKEFYSSTEFEKCYDAIEHINE